MRAGRGGSAERQRDGERPARKRRITAHARGLGTRMPAQRRRGQFDADRVLGQQALVQRLQFGLAPLGQNLALDQRPYRGQFGRCARRARSRTSTRCRPKPDSTGPLQCPGGSFISASANSCPKARATSRTRLERRFSRQHRRVAQVLRRRIGPAFAQPGQQFRGVGRHRRTALIRPQQHLAEGELRFGSEGFGMPLQPGRQLGVGRRRCSAHRRRAETRASGAGAA